MPIYLNILCNVSQPIAAKKRYCVLVCSNIYAVYDHLQDCAEAVMNLINTILYSVLCPDVDCIVSDYIKAASVHRNQNL